MSLKCNLGFHNWVGCRCITCGKLRDENHAWDDWAEDRPKCSLCGQTRELAATDIFEACKQGDTEKVRLSCKFSLAWFPAGTVKVRLPCITRL